MKKVLLSVCLMVVALSFVFAEDAVAPKSKKECLAECKATRNMCINVAEDNKAEVKKCKKEAVKCQKACKKIKKAKK